MPWRIVERRIGRAGGLKQRTARQREWDEKHGRDNWLIGYVAGHPDMTLEKFWQSKKCLAVWEEREP